jgi:hypothetical protein
VAIVARESPGGQSERSQKVDLIFDPPFSATSMVVLVNDDTCEKDGRSRPCSIMRADNVLEIETMSCISIRDFVVHWENFVATQVSGWHLLPGHAMFGYLNQGLL